MFDAWKKIHYSGKVGDLVRIPCKLNGSLTERYSSLLVAVGGKGGWRKDRNGLVPCQYFGLWPVEDNTEFSYNSGYTATYQGNNKYSVSADKKYFQDFMALKITVGTNEDVAFNPRSNINRWLKAISFTPRGFWFWILSIALSLPLVGLPLLFGCFYRLVKSFVAKSCLKKAKKSYKEKGKVVIF